MVARANATACSPAVRRSSRKVGLEPTEAPMENRVRQMPAVCTRSLAFSHLLGNTVSPTPIPKRK